MRSDSEGLSPPGTSVGGLDILSSIKYSVVRVT